MNKGWLLALVALGGCGHALDLQTGTVLEGFGFGWQLFNHRVSHLQVQARATDTQVAIIGGTSTTNQLLPPLNAGCDAATCKEFPFVDTADVAVDWANLKSERTAIASGSIFLEVGRDGATGVVSAPLPKGAPEVGTALLSGLALSTDHALSGGTACYHPEYGWHPRRLAIVLGAVEVKDGEVRAPVTATFAAGKTNDPDRVCIDEVNEQAIVDLEVDVTFLVGKGQVVDLELVQGAQYEFSGNSAAPEAQPDPSPIALDFGFEPTVSGFAALDFTFDPERTDDRGAYLRTLSFTTVPKSAPSPIVEANATSTNYSPVTQLTDFGYRFEGVVRAMDFEVDVARGTSTASLAAELDPDGAPVVTELPH